MTDIALILSPFAFWLACVIFGVTRQHMRKRSQIAHRLQTVIAQRDKYSPAEAAYWNRQRWQ